MVGAGRFERPTPCAQGRCATRLRYAPTSTSLSLSLSLSLILNYSPKSCKIERGSASDRQGVSLSRKARSILASWRSHHRSFIYVILDIIDHGNHGSYAEQIELHVVYEHTLCHQCRHRAANRRPGVRPGFTLSGEAIYNDGEGQVRKICNPPNSATPGEKRRSSDCRPSQLAIRPP